MDKILSKKSPVILIADDNAVIAMNHQLVLQKCGFEAVLAFSGEAAVEMVSDNLSIDMVLMDIDLDAGIDGVEATRRILAVRDLPVVFLTNHSERAFVAQVKQVTNYGYVLKNAGEFVLIETINMAFTLFDAKRALEREKEKYKRVIESTEESIISFDIEGKVLLINPKAASVLGGEPNDFIGKHLPEFLDSANAEHGMNTIRSVIETGQSVTQETEVVINGVSRWFEMRYQPIREKNGGITSALQLSLEVTAQKTAEQALLRNNIIFELVEELPSVAVVKVDSQLRAEYVSPSMLEVLGYSPQYFADTSVLEVVHTEDRAGLEEEISRTIAHQSESLFSEYRVYTSSGDVRWVETRARLSYTQHGEFDGAAYIQSDVTARKEKEIELKRALVENRHLMTELNHRVKNNLTMVSSLINLKDASIGPAADLSDIRNQVRAISFIHEKLQNTDDVTHIHIKPYVEDLLDSIFSFEQDTDLVLKTSLQPLSLPTKTVMNVGLILNELALNAIKHAFSENEQAVFRVLFETAQTGDHYIFSVANSGKIFSEDENPADPDSLGLQLVAAIAKQMDAAIHFSRHPETKFTFLIPVPSL